MQIAESVSKNHPDKICDIISDSIVDACIAQDRFSRVAMETIGGHGIIMLIGEVTTSATINFAEIAKSTYKRLTGKDIICLTNIVKQSPDIANKVDTGGAGDQGLMIGYACNENEMMIPQEMYLARKLLANISVDAKSQVVMDGDKVLSVVLSAQGYEQADLEKIVLSVCTPQEMFCNNIGRFDIGGFDADAGVTGRKIVVDAYGGRVPVGGGAFSGKDPTKVDRSAAYMARWIAVQLLRQKGAKEVLVKLGYVIGNPHPLIQEAIVDGTSERFEYDCRPNAIIERFDLRRPIYADLAEKGHFGRNLAWEV